MTIDQPVHAATRVVEEHPAGGPMHNVPLGTLVLRADLLPQAEIEDALREAVHAGRRLGEVLLERGLNETELARLLAAQNAQPFVDLTTFPLDPSVAGKLPPSVARIYCAFPFAQEDGAIAVAVPDPADERVRERLRDALGAEVRLVAAARADIKAAIDYMPVSPEEQRPSATYEVVVTLIDGRTILVDRMRDESLAEELAERVADEADRTARIRTRGGTIDGGDVVSVEILRTEDA